MITDGLDRGLSAGLSTPADLPECECPPEHSVGKLGHSPLCPWYPRPFPSNVHVESNRTEPTQFQVFICGRDGHADGTPHDYNWATYVDDETSTGVCRCGTREIDQAFWLD